MSFILSLSTCIKVDESQLPLKSAMGILRRDMEAILTGKGADNQIILIQDESMAPQTWRMVISDREVSIRYGDSLGGVYALLYISEQALGVKPMWFWNDQPLPKMAQANIPCGEYVCPAYAVKNRGWFINDEVLLDPWKQTDEEHWDVWRMAFETILRCGGNMVIPGTDRHGDNLDIMASDMGLTLTQHHAELLGAEMFGRRWPELKGSYRLYPEKFEQLWRESAQRLKGRNVIYAIGFRGQGDGPFWGEDNTFDTDEKRGAEVSRIMRRQMEIVREVEPEAMFCTNLYGEMMHLYRVGALEVPEGVVKIWADNGFGRMLSRRQGNHNPRVDAMPRHEAGQNGIYLHAGFYDLQAANHITQLQIPPAMIAAELNQVIDNGADDYWIVNCGSIKPHMYILDLIRQVWTAGQVDAEVHALQYAREYFGDERVAALLTGYAECAVAYGANPDDLAGDQYYHHAVRLLCWQLMRGETGPAAGLNWAEPADSIIAQAQGFAQRCAVSIPKWEKYIADCQQLAAQLPSHGAQLLRDTLMMNAQVHLSGCRVMVCLAEAFTAWDKGEYDYSFLHAGDALAEARVGYQHLRAAEHDKWIGIYRNDCFANLNLTVQALEALRSWIRVVHDGPNYWKWEQKWLMDPREVRICLQTHRHCQLSDEELYHRMKNKTD